MADIKTRKVDKGSIKTMDRSISASHRIRDAGSEIRQAGKREVDVSEQSVSEYSTARFEEGIHKTVIKTEHAAEWSVDKGAKIVQQKMRDHGVKEKLKAEVRSRDVMTRAVADEKAFDKVGGIKGRVNGAIKNRQNMKMRRDAKQAYVKSQEAMRNAAKNSYKATRTGASLVKRISESIARSARALYVSTKALISSIIAGGWVVVAIVVCCILFGAALYFFGDQSSSNYIPVSPEVEAYTDTIEKYCKEYEIPEYVELVKAIMMQESAGKGKDPMQSSECKYNTKYPKEPNGIKDPEYSIKCGVQYLKWNMNKAGVTSPVDMDKIKLAIQGYNFGTGYIPWALENFGGYSYASAVEYAEQQAEKKGWDSYGDKDYVDHVLRYYPFGNYSYDVIYNGTGVLGLPIEGMTSRNISSHFGPRHSPGGIGSTYHQGVDIAFPTGTKNLACEAGTVVSAGWNGGLGKCVIISHGNDLQTVYGHMSKINVATGQKVVRGQVIGEVGNTGNSTGPHLHLGVKLNGKYVNPEKGYLSIPK